MQERSSKNSSISGFVAGCTTWLLFPLDKMKIHMIVSEKHSGNYIPFYRSNMELWKNMYNKGFKYMYRGFHFQMSSSVAWAIYFSIYEKMKQIPSVDFRNNHSELYKLFVATGSSIIGNFLSNPLFVIKTRALLTQHTETWFSDTIESLIKTWKVDGIRGYWRGYSIGLLLSFDGAMTMYLYETFKENLPISDNSLKAFSAGSLSKLLACSLFFPIVSIKIRLQQEQFKKTILVKAKDVKETGGEMVYKGVINCIKKTWENQGFLGFYRGLSITLIKVIPTSGLFFCTYELTYAFLTQKSD